MNTQNPGSFKPTVNIASLDDIGPLCVSQQVQVRDLNLLQDSSSQIEKLKEAKAKSKKHESCLMKDSQVAQIKKVKPISKTRQLLKNDDAQVKQALASVLQKEQKVQEKMQRMMTCVEKNHSLANEWFTHQTSELDQYFEEIKSNLVALITQTIGQERSKLQNTLKQNFRDFSQDSRQLSLLFKNVLEDKNSFLRIVDQIKTQAPNNPHFEEIFNGYLINSCDLRFGFTPLVKKYHTFKDNAPSFDPLLHLQERFIISKICLLKESQNTFNEFAKILQQLHCTVGFRLQRLINPLKPFINALENSSKISNSIFPEDLFLPILEASEINLDSLKELTTPKEVTYNVSAEEKKALLQKRIIDNQDFCEISCDVRTFSTQNDMKKGVFISHNGVPYKILALDWVFPSHYVELENIITGNSERIQFHSRWHQIPFTVIPKQYTIVKSKENKEYYIVCSEKDKEMIFSLIEKKNVINDEISKEIDKRLKEANGGKVEVETIKLNDQDLIISIV